jgi:NADH-quinone oxidoreductase subunit L
MNIFIEYSLFIFFLPLAAFLINIFFGKRLPRQGDWVSIGAVLFTLALSIAMFAGMLFSYDPDFQVESSFTWINLGDFNIQLGFLVDNITITMLLVVALISSMSHIFSIKYMAGDPLYSRYYAYLSLFTFSMNGIVLSNNLMLLYMSWELVGLSSFLLIGFWFEKNSAASAGVKAFLTNRVGDIGFFIGIMLLFTAVGSVVYSDIFTSVADGNLTGTLLTMAGIGLFIGAMGKSSQFPLHIWLPDAMEGPTPVSALMHAATMVAAGVFMMVRMFPIMTPDALVFVAYIGGFTALFAATIAITQNDIKKVLAYSTVSQLGFMIMSVGTGAYVAAFFHLVTHAAFKANLFYGSGSVIHAMHHALHKKNDHETDPQDMRNMGGFKSRMPTTYRAMLVSTLAIAGVPFFSGFLSKDAILAGSLSFANHHPEHFLLPIFGFSAALLTAFYMFRLMYMTFHNEPQMPELIEEIHESPKEMTFPLVLLGGLSFFIFFTLPHFNPFSDQGWFTEIIRPRTSLVAGAPSAHAISEGIHQSHLPAMIISVLVGGFGIFLAWLMYLKQSISAAAMAGRFNTLYRLSLNKFYIDEIYSRFIYTPILKLADWVGYLDWDVYDKYVVDGFGRITEWFSNLTGKLDYDGLDQGIVDGAGRSAHWLGGVLRGLQTGQLQSYVLFALFGVILIVIFQTMV